jgi:WD40 repeat protein
MAATDDCSTVVFSNTLLMQVIVFRKSDGNFVEIETITETFPLSSISINPDGDMFLVARHTESSSVLYKYNECTELFTDDQELQEGEDDYATAITSSQIALGNNDGSIQVYDYQYGFK